MELTTLPAEKILKRSYKHFKVSSPETVAPVSKKLDFLYVGRKNKTIDLLINAFESGYAAESIDNAMSMLLRFTEQAMCQPDIIIVDGSLGYAEVENFSRFLSRFKSFQNAPLIIDATYINDDALKAYKGSGCVDDIILLGEYSKSRLITKVNFYKKVKQHAAEKKVPQVETASYSLTQFMKRSFDIVVSLMMLVALSPIFLLVMIALRIESRGPLFYISKRAGRGYKIFNFYKFRTMEVGADQRIEEISHLNQYKCSTSEIPFFIKINNDPRVTRLGAFLRSTSLDELPQLVNVLKGDMSLVGNRPLPLYEAASLTTDEWAKRFMAPAGITGLWQIKKKGKYTMSVEERIKLDINYADRYNFMYDLWIIANTPSALIQKTNA